MLVQYARKTQAAHRPCSHGSGEAGLIFTDGLAPSKSLPFPAPLLPTHHLPCLFRSQAFWGSRLSCLVLWGTHMSLSSLLLSRFQQELHPAQSWRQWWLGMACPGNWAAERDRLLVRQESVSAARGPDLKCLWRRSNADYAQWPICLSVRGNLILSPLDSIDLHSGDWFQGHKAYGWGCSCSWTRPDVIFFPLSLLETPLVVRSTGTVSADDPD